MMYLMRKKLHDVRYFSRPLAAGLEYTFKRFGGTSVPNLGHKQPRSTQTNMNLGTENQPNPELKGQTNPGPEHQADLNNNQQANSGTQGSSRRTYSDNEVDESIHQSANSSHKDKKEKKRTRRKKCDKGNKKKSGQDKQEQGQ